MIRRLLFWAELGLVGAVLTIGYLQGLAALWRWLARPW
jgi:hypothetical protein